MPILKVMSRRSRNKKRQEVARSLRDRHPGPLGLGTTRAWHNDLASETKKSILAVVVFILAALFTLSYIGKGGNVGGYIFRIFDALLGRGYFFAPLSLLLIGFSLIFSGEKRIIAASLIGGTLFLTVSLGGLHIIFGPSTGGIIGFLWGTSVLGLFDFWAGLIITLGFFAISILLILNIPLWKRKDQDAEKEEVDEETKSGVKTIIENINTALKNTLEKTAPASSEAITTQSSLTSSAHTSVISVDTTLTREKAEPLISVRGVAKKFGYRKPPMELLQGDKGTPSSGDIKANANIIKRTLENFGIDVEMGEISIGPTVTQYTLRPAEGIKLSRITALHSDLSLALAAHPIRIEAPIPGKSLVGIEVPNRSIALVGLQALLQHKIFQETQQPLLFALGRDVSGGPVFADLAKMPHLLVSGATGSGKSVCIHSIISSFVYRNPPEALRFIIVDPKRVELSVYNDIPHLLTPVITDAKKTMQSLHWATKEMDRRYDLLSSSKVRDIENFNVLAAKEKDEGLEMLPYIVIIIDELADLMATFPREIESSIIRIAQMARAVGIHLIVATQRPSVEVITGLIKANITSRIAFQVASQVDSRTVLDTAGAERLLGNGDMLFLAGDTAKPRRIQGAFVSEQEVKKVVEFLSENETPEYQEEILHTKIEEEGLDALEKFGDDDPIYDQAQELVVQAGKASASYLQRRLRVGYARAARLLDLMEVRGVIGPADGAKPREVFIKTADSKLEDHLLS